VLFHDSDEILNDAVFDEDIAITPDKCMREGNGPGFFEAMPWVLLLSK